ncbi:MAG: hypothetical protein KDJ86_13120 [Bauldia sp.]|uniref:hypothetical protein n=1 Tax=Bauldia sp. TaxID=2575872 RepID=UPI001DB0637E|nr:hypothetical protein [Bauldia sp.]MCB1496724.1 hypothetical protein [Bauldia sp.]
MVRNEKTDQRQGVRRAGRAGAGLILVALALGLAGEPGFAADDPILAQMAGNWVGRGTFKSSPSAEPELVYCKITNTLSNGGTTLNQKGRCAVATNSGRISGTIRAQGSGAYDGSLESLSTKGPLTFSGKASNNQIALNASFVDRKTNKPGKASIQTVVGNGKYRTVSKTTDTKTRTEFVASDITFTKQ